MFIDGFKKYLREAKITKSGTSLSTNSAISYLNKLKAALSQAFVDRIILENPGKRVKGIKPEETNRQFLLEEELKTLATTECEYPLLKKAFLFSCLTGLRNKMLVALLSFGFILSGCNRNDHSARNRIIRKSEKATNIDSIIHIETSVQRLPSVISEISSNTEHFLTNQLQIFSPRFLIENDQIAEMKKMIKVLTETNTKFHTKKDIDDFNRTEVTFKDKRILYSKGWILAVSFEKKDISREDVFKCFGLNINEDYFLDGYSIEAESLDSQHRSNYLWRRR